MNSTIEDIGEFGLIRRIGDLLDREGIKSPEVEIGIGDDCASFLPKSDREILVTCDCLIENRHYLPEYISPRDLGRRAMVMNISDIGAMGGYPLYAIISLGLKGDTLIGDVDSLYMGFLEELKPFNASILGGNITRSEQKTFIDITMIGEVEREIAVRRSAAIKGDSILVTGYPGRAAAGLRMLLDNPDKSIQSHPLVSAYNRPSHRAREGRAIAKSGFARAMIDISDGFLGDLGHICEQSGMGAEIIRDNLPICESMGEMEDRYDLVMKESDDYELIITCPPENNEKIREVIASVSDIDVTEVGRITDASEGIVLILPDGTRIDQSPGGWDHFRG